MKRLRLLVPVLLVLFLPLVSCGYNAEEVESAYTEGYAIGYDQGQSDSYSEEDLVEARTEAYNAGRSDGFEQGRVSRAPLTAAERIANVEDLLRNFQAGHNEGYSLGFNKGYDEGFEDGYLAGKNSK